MPRVRFHKRGRYADKPNLPQVIVEKDGDVHEVSDYVADLFVGAGRAELLSETVEEVPVMAGLAPPPEAAPEQDEEEVGEWNGTPEDQLPLEPSQPKKAPRKKVGRKKAPRRAAAVDPTE